MNFQEKLRCLREERNLTQTELGNQLNMHQMKISRMETGYAEPSLGDIRALCLFFEVSADYLLDVPQGFSYPTR